VRHTLNHPNIAAIYGLEDADGVKALVMELVEGPTLADRIADVAPREGAPYNLAARAPHHLAAGPTTPPT
jgi:serine/threonine protein kinase